MAPINAGQGVAVLRDIRRAAEVIDQLCTEASRLDRAAPSPFRARIAGTPYAILFTGLWSVK